MANKTIDQKLVIREPELQGHKEGYSRVIMRESGKGREFVKLLKNSEKLKLPRWRPKDDLVTYYVDEHPHLRFETDPSLRLHVSHIKGRSFTLIFNLKYTVSNPKSLVTHYDRDPLGEIEREIKKLLPGPIESLPWEEILKDTTNFTSIALGEKTFGENGEIVNCMTYLRQFSDRLGIQLIDLSISRTLSEEAMRLPNQTAEDEQAIEIKRLEEERKRSMMQSERDRKAQEHIYRMIDQDRQKEFEALTAHRNAQIKLYETFIQSVEGTVERNLNQVRSIPEVSRFISEMQNLMGPQGAFLRNELSSSENSKAIADQSHSNDPADILASGNISDLVLRLEAGAESLQDSAARQELMAAALHLLAEAQLTPDKQCNMDKYVANLKCVVREQAQKFTPGDFELLINLIEHYQDER